MCAYKRLFILAFILLNSSSLLAAEHKNVLVSDVLSYVRTQTKTHMVFLLDGSGSISVDDWGLMKLGMQTILLKAQSANLLASILVFSNTTTTIFSKRVMNENNKDLSMKDIANMEQPRAFTNLGTGLQEVLKLMQSTPADTEKLLVIFTDGFPSDDPHEHALALKTLKCKITSIGYGPADFNFLHRISDEVMQVADLSTFVSELYSQTSTFEADIFFIVSVTNRDSLSFDSNLALRIEVLNYDPTFNIPSGCSMKFSEVARLKNRIHFNTKTEKIGAVVAGSKYVFETTLLAAPGADIRTLPKYILYTLSCDSMQVTAKMELVSAYFVSDIIKFFEGQYSHINLLLVGPVGSGKTTLKNLIITALTSKKERIFAGVEGSGTWHTTNHTSIIDVRKFYDRNPEDKKRLENVQLQIVDTQGMDSSNFNNGFMGYLLEGVVPDGTKGATGNEKFKSRINDKSREVLKEVAHAVVFVISCKLANHAADDPLISKLRENVQVAISKNYSPIVAVTHMDTLSEDHWEEVLEMVSEIGLGRASAFPIAHSSTTTYREFESDMQVLCVLHRALQNAESWLQGYNPEKDEL